MTDFAPLGFQIDTAPLKDAAAAARTTAAELVKVADTTERAATAANRRLDIAKKALEAEQAAAKAAGEASNAAVQAAEKSVAAAERNAAAKNREAAASRSLADAAAREAKAHHDAAAAKDKTNSSGQRATETVKQLAQQAEAAALRFQSTATAATALANGLGSGGATGLTNAASMAATGLSRMLPALGGVGVAASAAVASVAALGAAYAGALVYLAPFQDRLDQINGRLKNTFGSQSVAENMYKALVATSQSTGLGMQPTTDSFLRLARTREDIGATGSDVMLLTELSQKLGRVSGASQGETAGAMLQLSQALASGRLQGDELRSIMESMPALAKAIADGLGVSVGQLRTMGSEGQLTSDKVFGAILSQTDKIRKEFASLPETLDQATTRMSDSWERLMGNMGKAADASPKLQWLVNQANSAVAAAADYMDQSETAKLASKLDDLQSQLRSAKRLERRAAQAQSAGSGLVGDMFFGGQGQLNINAYQRAQEREEIERQIRTIRAQQFRASENASMDSFKETQTKYGASVSNATKIVAENDKISASQKEIAEQTRKVTDAIGYLEKGLTDLSPEQAAAKLAILKTELGALKTQADTAVDAFAKFNNETAKMAANRAKYGADASIGTEIDKIVEQAALDRRPITEDQARASVIARRMEEARLKATKEVEELDRLRETVRRGVASREQIAAETAAEARRAELGATLAATPDGARQIEEARRRAAETFRLNRQRSEQESYLAPEARPGGDVAREIAQTRRETESLLATIGGTAAQRAAARFESQLSEKLRQIPDNLKADYEKAERDRFRAEQRQQEADVARGISQTRREAEMLLAMIGGTAGQRAAAQFEMQLAQRLRDIPDALKSEFASSERAKFSAQQQQTASDFVKAYEDRVRLAREELAVGGLTGKEHEVALSMIRAQNDAISRGVDLTGDRLARVRQAVEAEAEVNEQIKKQAEGVQRLDSLRSTSRSAIGSLLRGDAAGAGQAFVDYATNQTADSLTEALMGKQGEKGGGLLGGLFGGIFGTGVGERGTPTNPMFVTWAGVGGAGVIGGLLSGGASNADGAGGSITGGAVDRAFGLIGLNEKSNRGTINAFLKAGGVDLDAAQAAWCAAFVNSSLEQIGVNGSGSNVANSFQNWGTRINPASVLRGDILLQTNGLGAGDTGGHVGFATGQSRMGPAGLQLQMLSGNAADAVGTSWVDAMGVQARRATSEMSALSTSTATASSGLNSLASGFEKAVGGIDGAMGGATGGPLVLGGGVRSGMVNGGQGIFGSIGTIFNLLTSGLTSIFSGIGSIFGGLFHDGSADIGLGPSSGRWLPATAYANAPRHHSGVNLASDERPAILQTGERVLSRLDNARLVAGVEAMGRRTDAANDNAAAGSITVVNHNDFRGVDPSMRAFITAQIAASQRSTVAAAVSEVQSRSQKVPSYMGR